MNNQGFEIEFLQVGDSERSGDAIVMRYGIPGSYKVMVYDGGTKESGNAVVEHIKKYYGTNRVDYVVSSHPDSDHASGLSVVLEKMDVGELWMHCPWNHSAANHGYFIDGRMTQTSLAQRLKEELSYAYDLELIAKRKGVPIHEPFALSKIGDMVILSPDREWYIHELIAQFEKSPQQKESLGVGGFARAVVEAARRMVDFVAETWNLELLRENVETAAENESSVILFGTFDGNHGVLLTGDAGIRALSRVADLTESRGISLPSVLRFIQVPHHGSRHNVSTSVLDRIVGGRKPTDDGTRTKMAMVSVGKKSTTHPRKAVVNAFLRRGVSVVRTDGTIRYSHKMPDRDWGRAQLMPFSQQVETWD